MAVMERERRTDEQRDQALMRIDGDLRELRVEMRKGFEKIDQRFKEMDRRFEQVDKRFEQVDKRFEQVDKRFEGIDARFDAVQRNIFIGLVTINASLIGGLLAMHS